MPALGMLPSPLCPSLWFPMPAGQLQLGCLELCGAIPGCFCALCPAWAGTGMQNRRLVWLHPRSTAHLCSCLLCSASPLQGRDGPGDLMARWSCQAGHQEPAEMLHPTPCTTSTPASLHKCPQHSIQAVAGVRNRGCPCCPQRAALPGASTSLFAAAGLAAVTSQPFLLVVSVSGMQSIGARLPAAGRQAGSPCQPLSAARAGFCPC